MDVSGQTQIRVRLCLDSLLFVIGIQWTFGLKPSMLPMSRSLNCWVALTTFLFEAAPPGTVSIPRHSILEV